ncbi:MAG: M48 family metallopeptidase [Planctomycetota bacterium]|jgi:Zn-dependent protease with chaperone function
MHLFPVFLIAVLAAADSGMGAPSPWFGLEIGGRVAVALLPPAVIVLVTWIAVASALRRDGRPERLVAALRVLAGARWLLVIHFVTAVMGFGWLDTVRSGTGNLLLVDELVALTPTVLAVLVTWWLHHPLEARMRQALLIRSLDLGRPVHPMPSRGAHVLLQARSGLLLLGLPLVLILGCSELIDIAWSRWGLERGGWTIDAIKLTSALGIFILSPLLARLVLTVRPLAPGPVRDDLLAICARHRVRVRDVLVWNTSGSIINAAVMGLIGRLRFVLLTDALLESMTAPQLEAVMAHEVAHVRRSHIPWLIVTLLAALSGTVVLSQMPILLAELLGWREPADGLLPVWAELPIVTGQVVVALVAFGWVSRRFERQADTFAVQHLSGLGSEHASAETAVAPEAVAAMQNALDRIARLSTINPSKHSWRHGSIVWRQNYLATIVGVPIADLPIDRLVRSIKLLAGFVLVGSIGIEVGLHALATNDAPVAARPAVRVVAATGGADAARPEVEP